MAARKHKFLSQLLFLIQLVLIQISSNTAQRRATKCEKIIIPMCTNVGYNRTQMPNYLSHESQEDAAIRVHEYLPLVKVNCSPYLKFFLCSLFAPMCSEEVDYPITACRSMCEAARTGCSPVMEKFGFNWPKDLDCGRLPDPKKDSILCMASPGSQTSRGQKTDGGNIGGGGRNNNRNKNNNSPTLSSSFNISFRCGFTKSFKFLPKTQDMEAQCVPKCKANVYFAQKDKEFAEIWIGVWSILCYFSTAMTVLTFLVDTSRFKYPERPIIFLSVCYHFYSIGYLIRLFAGRDSIICDKTGNHLVVAGLNTTGCTMVFLMLYFFGMASSLWWVMLSFTWFLSSGLKWGHEAIEKKASYFHMFVWTLAAIQAILVLIMKKADSDELTGLCFVGNQNADNLPGFVIAPLSIYVFVGTVFLLWGFIALFRIRSVLKTRDTNIQKLEKLMIRIGVFAVMYTVPATCVIASYFYEYSSMETWQKTALLQCYNKDSCISVVGPKVEVYMVKYFMSLIVGVTSGMWIWSTKTFQSWRNFYRRNIARKQYIPRNGGQHNSLKKPTPRSGDSTYVTPSLVAPPNYSNTRVMTV